MNTELLVLLVMLGVFLLGNLVFKLPVSLSMILCAVGGALVAGEGIPVRHLFEGCFTYIDTILIISTAMLFMMAIQRIAVTELKIMCGDSCICRFLRSVSARSCSAFSLAVIS